MIAQAMEKSAAVDLAQRESIEGFVYAVMGRIQHRHTGLYFHFLPRRADLIASLALHRLFPYNKGSTDSRSRLLAPLCSWGQ